MSTEILSRSLAGSPTARAYLSREPAILPFFGGDPTDSGAFRRQWESVRARFGRTEREQAAAALRPTSERAAARLHRFVEEGGAVITTGQQAGLFTGPLYTIYKILSTVRLAAAVEETLGVLTLPVFWVASEDHDWEEVDHAFVVSGTDQLARIQLPSMELRPLPMSERRLDHEVEIALDELSHHLQDSEHRDYIIKLFRDRYRPGETVASAFRGVVEELFRRFDLLVVDAADPALKLASRPVLRAALDRRAGHERILASTQECLRERGFVAQVPILTGGANLFVHLPRGRERLYRETDRWVTHDSRRRFSDEEIRELLDAEPRRLSPNVLLRPVVESWVFPTLAYVAGPGEISYFAQLKPLFEDYGLTMPIIVPRASLLLVEPSVRRALDRIGLCVGDLDAPRHELLEQRSREQLPTEIASALQALRISITDRYDALARMAGRIDPTLEIAIGARRNRALAGAAESERKILRALKRRDSMWAARLDRVRTHLFPGDEPQERVLTLAPFLAAYGTGLLDDLAAAIPAPW
ncbi:MAG: bacillithiol biosynthesis cysteine-adding enzyme BshC [Gemmatimonadetes bacterium]|nr:bacillithiol biosynthesis cysteine-adding enzyme BshC [Gemmatimonadota bacterium]